MMPAQHRDVCQPSAMDDGIVYRPNRGQLLCCIKALISIKPYIKAITAYLKVLDNNKEKNIPFRAVLAQVLRDPLH